MRRETALPDKPSVPIVCGTPICQYGNRNRTIAFLSVTWPCHLYCAVHFRVCRQCADFQSLTIIRHSQAEGCAVFSPLRPPPGGRRLAAAPTDFSACTGSAPNHKPKAVCHEPRFPSRPATLPRPPFCPLPRSALFFPAAALVKKKTSRKRRERWDEKAPAVPW
jgi:hypothetical protein